MKKKLALLLAFMMAMSLTPVAVFAASSNRLSRDVRTVPKQTVLFDPVISSSTASAPYNLTGTKKTMDNRTISSFVSGMDLVLEFRDSIRAGDAFRLQLDNAEWFFETDMANPVKPADSVRAYGDRITASSAAMTYDFDDSTGINYTITVSSTNRRSAVVSFNNDFVITPTTAANDKTVFVPLCIYIPDENVDVTVSLVDNSSPATSGTFLVASSRAGATTTSAVSIRSGRETISLDTIVIKENRTGSLNRKGAIELVAPEGYRFRDKFSGASRISITSEYGMGAVVADSWGYKWTDTTNQTSVALDITTSSTSTDKIPGAILISGLEIEPLDFNATPNIGEILRMSINNYEDATGWRGAGTSLAGSYTPTADKLNVRAESFDVARVVDWAVTMTADEPRTLIGGRYPTSSSDDSIRAAKVTMNEEEIRSWLVERVTNFELPDGVKILAVRFDSVAGLTGVPSGLVDVRGTMPIDSVRHTNDTLTITEGNMSLRGITRTTDNTRARLEFTLFLSIDPNYEGPITLKSSGSALSGQEQVVTIAEAIPPIVISSKSKNVQVGFQSYEVNDITITETVAGALLRDGILNLKPYDYVGSTDVLFQPISASNVEITEGNVVLNLRDTRSGIITFEVGRASTTPSTIKLSGLEVRTSRGVPYGTYDVTAYGSAVFRNFNFNMDGTRANPDLVSFYKEDEGIILPGYINIVSELANVNPVTHNNVKITANSNVILVGGESFVLDVAPFIDPTSNSFLVPVRFVAAALGIPETNIFWDQNTNTATIISTDNSRTVQFTADSDVMLVNGARQTMVTNGYNVRARIIDGRLFIPFRYVGVGLGISNERIVWNEATQSAEFNPVAMD